MAIAAARDGYDRGSGQSSAPVVHGAPSCGAMTRIGFSGGARAYLSGSGRRDVYSAGATYVNSGNGQVSGPCGLEKFDRVDPSLIYATYEQLRDNHWAGHDKLMHDLTIGKATVEPFDKSLEEIVKRKPKILNRLHELPDQC